MKVVPGMTFYSLSLSHTHTHAHTHTHTHTHTKPKYIHVLKKTAERRKLEQDIVYERKAQREIEQEGRVCKVG